MDGTCGCNSIAVQLIDNQFVIRSAEFYYNLCLELTKILLLHHMIVITHHRLAFHRTIRITPFGSKTSDRFKSLWITVFHVFFLSTSLFLKLFTTWMIENRHYNCTRPETWMNITFFTWIITLLILFFNRHVLAWFHALIFRGKIFIIVAAKCQQKIISKRICVRCVRFREILKIEQCYFYMRALLRNSKPSCGLTSTEWGAIKYQMLMRHSHLTTWLPSQSIWYSGSTEPIQFLHEPNLYGKIVEQFTVSLSVFSALMSFYAIRNWHTPNNNNILSYDK